MSRWARVGIVLTGLLGVALALVSLRALFRSGSVLGGFGLAVAGASLLGVAVLSAPSAVHGPLPAARRLSRRRLLAACVLPVLLVVLLLPSKRYGRFSTTFEPRSAQQGLGGVGRGSGGQQQNQGTTFGTLIDTTQRFKPGSDAKVFTYTAPDDEPSLLRAVGFDVWDGRTWRVLRGREASTLLYNRTGRIEVPASSDDGDRGRFIVQTIKLAQDGPTVVGRARVAAITPPSGVGAVARDPLTGSLVGDLRKGAVYSVESEQPEATPAQLRVIDPTDAGPMVDRAMPPLTPRVAELARTLVSGAPTPYDGVQAAVTWIRENTRYTFDIEPTPADGDAVDRFLFVDKAGYCQQAASALVVLLRSVGIPARFVVGWSAPPSGGRPVDVTEANAHAWVEVLFPGVGWVSFDATPPGAAVAAPSSSGSWWWLLLALPVLLVVGAAIVAVRRRAVSAEAERSLTWSERTMASLRDLATIDGVAPPPGRTAAQLVGAIPARDPAVDLAAVSCAIDDEVFGAGATPEARALVDELLTRAAAVAAADQASSTSS